MSAVAERSVVVYPRLPNFTSGRPSEYLAATQAILDLQSYELPASIGSRPKFVLRRQFDVLADRLYRDTHYIASPASIRNHPSFEQIKRMGQAAVPMILRRLDAESIVWLIALREILGESPVAEESRGLIDRMVDDWKRWGRERHHIP
jgi:hypothetical protein